ncbi:MAG: 50S ribosome-binding GTPase [Thiothrix sp.]|nr:50S ribosome-binding GTPase [Thiothrix sp.]HPQ94984.1 50S ribosome-binding GTPase [Thiolinea sp.]
MKVANKMRWLIAAIIAVSTLLFLLFLFFATSTFLDLWTRMSQLPGWLVYTYLALILLVLGGSFWLIWRLFRNERPSLRHKAMDEKQLMAEMEQMEAAGLDIRHVREELTRLQARRSTGQINIAFFGDVSTGKSSIIKAILPEQNIEVSLRGGSTREIREYVWATPSGDRLLLTDLPGRNEADGVLDDMVRDEAVRAQIVVYVVDSDLSRNQLEDIRELHAFGKPLLIALNKSDFYTDEEQQQLTGRILSRFQSTEHQTQADADKPAPPVPKVVFIQSGGMEEVLKVNAEGREETVLRPRKVNVQPLVSQLQKEIDSHIEWLEQLRDASVFSLVHQKLDESRLNYRRKEAEKIIRNSTRNAIIGAMAAMTPGTDLVIQGVLGARMVKQLCDLYESPVKQLDIDNFLDFSQGQLKKSIPILLAVAGNTLKAFPGIGTVAGGLVHAVAYGIIFDALGHSVAYTLEKRGTLKAAPAALTFREMLSGNLEERTKTFARLVIDQYRSKDDRRS